MADFMVKYYYILMRNTPRELDEFYYDVSEHVRREKYGSLNATNTKEMMKTKTPSLNYGHMEVDFLSFDVQKSLNGGIDVLVAGYLTGKDNVVSGLVFMAQRHIYLCISE
ncbi:Ras GTPase-activating protein-binding protein 1-like protein isoform X1, partial [Tanacetum coccineum]